MAQFNITINNGNAPYTVSVKKIGDNTERWISGGTTGTGLVVFTHDIGTFIYNIIVTKLGCVQATSGFTLTCNAIIPPIIPPIVVSCDIIINNISIQCTDAISSTIVVDATSPTNKVLKYGIQGFKYYQTSNTFNIGNSDSNGYTFIVADVANESCNKRSNKVVNCNVPVIPPTTLPAVCDIIINSVATQCNSSTSSTTVVNASSLSGKTLRYGILGLADYQTSNTFNLGNSDANGYTFIVAELNNITCNARTNRVVNCNIASPAVSTNCYTNVNFTVTDNNYGTPAQQNNTAVTFSRCGQIDTPDTRQYIVNSLGLIVPFYHNQTYTLATCVTIASIQTLGGWTITINSSASCSV